ncbi:AAA family ATPase [Sporanaerobacter acetigenes]|uniref:Nuclease SbcCD subunit C n=1 Tax=Sporanaerobacter acetigenes DSM 13106 TaxID=1123281 RepID=A0A1M5XKM5_9FIRM|nr:AAA family ATPase [Sporanaerobacter acetigenes]SHI00296.1 exonuclease SbcC [Sporanaerobacter acetigenes DSM 13106]
MKYIKKAILENFQSHKYSEIDFDNNLNVIVGPSDQGKSAIIRGIKWALFNEPSGDFFIREGENECSVTIIFNDNTKIKRYRNKSKNLYYLYDENGKETIFEGFGTSVPQEITEKINIRKIYLDGKQTNSINISDQLEGPFLLSEKTVTRANAIGRLVGVHIVDDAVGGTLKDIRNLNLLKKNLEDQLDTLNENLKEYDYLEKLRINIEQLEDKKNAIKDLETKVEKLKSISIKLKELNKDIAYSELMITKLQNLNYFKNLIDKLNREIKAYILIKEKQYTLLNVNKNICYNEDIIAKLKNLDTVKNCIKNSELKVKKIDKLENAKNKYTVTAESLNYNKNILIGLKDTDGVETKIYLINEYIKKMLNLKSFQLRVTEINKRIAYGNIYFSKFEKINIIENNLSDIGYKTKMLSKLNNLKEQQEQIEIELNKNIKTMQDKDEKIKILLDEYKNLLSKFEVCPLCFNRIDEATIDKIVDNYK